MTPDKRSGVTPSLDAGALVAAVPGLSDVASVGSETIASIGSANISIDMLVGLCRRAEAQDVDGIVITQGTDTLEECAFVVNLLYQGEKPLVFTGAMRPAMQPGADGPNNLYNAVLVASSRSAPRVSVVMNSEIHDPWHVSKEHTFATDAFVSDYSGPLGHVIEQKVKLKPVPPLTFRVPLLERPVPQVALVVATLGTDTRMVDMVLDLGYEGLVVEAFGAGHVSEQWADSLEKVAAQIPVILSTRVRSGPVLENSYGYKGAEIDLIKRGLIPSGSLSGRKARLLLSLLLAAPSMNCRGTFKSIIARL